MVSLFKVGLAAVVVSGTLAISAGAASAAENHRPICNGTSFNMPHPDESVAIKVLSPNLVADPDGDPLQIIDVFGPRDGVAAVGDSGTPDDTTDDVIMYTRTAPLLWGFYARSEHIYYSVSDGELSSQCSAHFFPSNIW